MSERVVVKGEIIIIIIIIRVMIPCKPAEPGPSYQEYLFISENRGLINSRAALFGGD